MGEESSSWIMNVLILGGALNMCTCCKYGQKATSWALGGLELVRYSLVSFVTFCYINLIFISTNFVKLCLCSRHLMQSAQQCPNRYSEPDNRDWRGWSVQLPASSEEKSWENLRENREFGNRFDSRNQDSNQFNRQDQLNSQFARAHISSNQVITSSGILCYLLGSEDIFVSVGKTYVFCGIVFFKTAYLFDFVTGPI